MCIRDRVHKDLELVGEAENGVEAVRRAQLLHPDVVLMDLKMPEMDGVAATREIRAQNPKTRVIVLTSFAEDNMVQGALQAGATGYLLGEANRGLSYMFIMMNEARLGVGLQGVAIGETGLSGYIWSENIGWICVGDGSPASGVAYGNVTGADFGVNRDPQTGVLTGLAWGENIGWIDFGGGAAATPRREAVDGNLYWITKDEWLRRKSVE